MKRKYYIIYSNKNQLGNKKYKHLSYEQRLEIEFLLKNKKKLKITMKDIAQQVGISERTLYREKKRGMVQGLLNSDLTTRDEYSGYFSQHKYEQMQKTKQDNLKIGKNIELANFLEYLMLEEKYSPYAAIQKAKKLGYMVNICEKTVYNYIHKEIFLKMTAKDLPYSKKKKPKQPKQKTIRKMGGKSTFLLVMTDRLSRKQIIVKIKEKKSKYVVQEIEKQKKKYKKTFNERFKTITSDNGSEFMNAKAIEQMGVKQYYAHSYLSYERGTNESNNKLIRRFIKKGTDISKISHKKIKQIQEWMNDYPRRIFGGKSANEIHLERRIIEQ